MLKWPKDIGNLLVIDRVTYKVLLCYPALPLRGQVNKEAPLLEKKG